MAKIWLSFNNQKEKMYLPVLPEKFVVKEKSKNKTFNLQNIGEVTVINPVAPKSITIKSFFPVIYEDGNQPYVNHKSKQYKTPFDYVKKIQQWRSTYKPIRLKTEDMAENLSIPVTIESFTYEEVAGAVGDIYYTLELKEYRWYNIKKTNIYQSTSDSSDENTDTSNTNERIMEEERNVEKEPVIQYTVKAGDTLYAICKAQLGDGNKYKEIAEKNGISNPNLIYIGQVLML